MLQVFDSTNRCRQVIVESSGYVPFSERQKTYAMHIVKVLETTVTSGLKY